MDIAERNGAALRLSLRSADRFRERAIFLGSSDLNMSRSRSRASLCSVTSADHFRLCLAAPMGEIPASSLLQSASGAPVPAPPSATSPRWPPQHKTHSSQPRRFSHRGASNSQSTAPGRLMYGSAMANLLRELGIDRESKGNFVPHTAASRTLRPAQRTRCVRCRLRGQYQGQEVARSGGLRAGNPAQSRSPRRCRGRPSGRRRRGLPHPDSRRPAARLGQRRRRRSARARRLRRGHVLPAQGRGDARPCHRPVRALHPRGGPATRRLARRAGRPRRPGRGGAGADAGDPPGDRRPRPRRAIRTPSSARSWPSANRPRTHWASWRPSTARRP